jgi:molybdopterin-containing oxidoreductase family membrane subunit
MIPDLALLRDSTPRRRWLYRTLALGWKGTPKQWHRLETAISVMAVLIIPIAVSVHTVVSWIFAMTLNPMWHSTIFAPYFVVGAIFSGIAILLLAMSILRKSLRLEMYLRPVHFNNVGLLLLALSLIWLYFTLAEYVTTWYGDLPEEMAVFRYKLAGPLAPYFWGMVACCFLIPAPVLAFKKTRTIAGTTAAAALVVVGMWLERYVIVVGTLTHPRLAFNWRDYAPTWVELSIMAGAFAYFAFLFVLFTKLFPIISVWEWKAGLPSASSPPPSPGATLSHEPLPR